ncbi:MULTISPECIES: alpha/beta hydrolase [Protofrankia]|uniref:Lysophospholipase n=1 Tax=Protofrankia coriariae TaxID=1562887 RepID=A0ABR5EZ18_9ACTN|nr:MULTISPECIES: alpha/beta hydrolase [Protofrankia]KLL09650.1 lysophospholipase [Protofrankia coriariae]ONH32330.1 lysophospholipase [Protofrankia sp. BMG5.30]
MTSPGTITTLAGSHGALALHRWSAQQPSFVALLAHGYGEHAGRYDHVARRLSDAGGAVYAPDHIGHGRSEGERAHVELLEDIVTDLGTVAKHATAEHPGLPVVLIGHSLGGIVAVRYVQRAVGPVDALVLSGPVIGGNPAIFALLDLDPIPDVPLDPAALSRDPAVGAAYAADPLVYHGPFHRESLQTLKDVVATIAAGPGLGDLPTLWIHGELDPLAPLAETRAAFERIGGSNLRQKVYPGALHEIFNETNSDEVLDDVVAFVREAVPAR